jgi:DNA-binding PadR family transcriptional regulator
VPRASRISNAVLHHENDPLLLVLMGLADGPKHGHALIGDIERFADVRLGPGTLYGAITRLEHEGFVEPLEPEERRRPYRITDTGVTALLGLLESMEAVARVGRERLQRCDLRRRLEVEAG